MEAIRGYRVKNRKGLAHWMALLEEWLLAHERYCRIMGNRDAAYWYNERANIGVLGGAAWRCGWIALEEFQARKGYRNQKKSSGRSDLWVASDKAEEVIEAKFSWLSLRSTKLETIVLRRLDEAVADAKRSSGNGDVGDPIGVAFFSMHIEGNFIEDMDDEINKCLERFLCADYHALAWCFPTETRKWLFEKENKINPGVFMAVKNARYP